MRNANLGRVLS